MSRSGRSVLFVPFVVLVDCLIIFDAFSLAYLLRFELQFSTFYWPPEPPAEYLKAMVVVAYFWILLFKVAGLYDFSRTRSSLDSVHLIARTVSFGTLVILSLSYFYREFSFSRLVCVYAWALSLVLFTAFRIVLGRLRSQLYREGQGVRNVVLIGSRSLAAFLVERLGSRPELGYRVVGALDDEPPSQRLGCRVLGRVNDLEGIARREKVDRVFIAHPALGHLQQLHVIATCERLGLPLSIVPPTFDLLINYRDFEEIDGMPLVSIREQEAHRIYSVAKRACDLVAGSILLVLLAPLAALAALLIWLEDQGPVFFTQTRVGKDGRTFRMLKLRTMVVNAEALLPSLVDVAALSEPVFKLEHDPRVTRVGRWLRRASIDELPQLWNVLKGEMSLVGPRPEEEQVVRLYGIWERRRLKAKPGITGLQQVECRGSTSLRERVRWDIVYLRKQSLLLDLWICWRTLGAVISGRGAG